MYNEKIKTPDQALCHLYFHCGLKDGNLTANEIDAMADRFVTLGLQKELSFKSEMDAYRSYREKIIDEWIYLEYLFKLISPVNTLALFSYCLELFISDENFSQAEADTLKMIGSVLEISEEQQAVILKTFSERKVVETSKIV
jgi:hypothetical protein